jgi:hypothetical protein
MKLWISIRMMGALLNGNNSVSELIFLSTNRTISCFHIYIFLQLSEYHLLPCFSIYFLSAKTIPLDSNAFLEYCIAP